MTRFSSLDEVRGALGTHLGYSDWRGIDQEMVNRFADVTDDHQWIHVDPERAAKEGPFGGTIAHGYLTLSLTSAMLAEVVEFGGISFAVNYGSNRVRFPAPVPVGSRLRAGCQLTAVEEVAGGIQTTITVTFEVEGSSKPACVAEILSRLYA